MLLGDVNQALLKFFLVLHINNALILHLIEFLFVALTLASVPLTHFLLLVKKVTPFRLNSFEIFLDA